MRLVFSFKIDKTEHTEINLGAAEAGQVRNRSLAKFSNRLSKDHINRYGSPDRL